MSELKNNLNLILQEKTNKIISQNLKKDVQVFDITGSYDKEDIKELQDKLEKSKEELKSAKRDIENSSAEVSGTGEYVILNNTVGNARFKKAPLPEGNSTQNTTTGKNLLNTENLSEFTTNGITFTPVYDGKFLKYIEANGTATANAFYADNKITHIFEAGVNYILSGCPSGGGSTTYSIYYGQSSSNADTGDGRTIIASETTTYQVALLVRNGYTANKLRFYPMVRLASVTDNTYEPYTNGASPNPDYEQPISNCGGNMNLLSSTATSQTLNGVTFTVNNDGTVIANGTATANANFIFIDNLSLSGGTYTLSGCPSGGSLDIYYLGTNIMGSMWQEIGNGLVFTPTSDVSNKTINIVIKSGITVNNLLFKPKLEKGSKATPYSPYGMRSITEKIINDNLLNKDVWVAGYINSSGIFVSQSYQALFDYIKVIPNTQYTIESKQTISAINYVEYDEQLNMIQRTINSNRTKTFTTTANTRYISVWINYDNSTAITQAMIDSLELILNKGGTALAYKPHQEQIYSLNLGDIEMCKINGYADKFFKNEPNNPYYDSSLAKNKWYKKKFIEHIQFDDTTNLTCYHDTTANSSFQFSGPAEVYASQHSRLFCNYAKYWTNSWRALGAFMAYDGRPFLIIPDNSFGFSSDMTAEQALALLNEK